MAVVVTEPAPAAKAPPAIRSNTLEVLPSPASVPAQWPELISDTLHPSQIDAPPAYAVPEFRSPGPRRALLASGIFACAGLIWFVGTSAQSEPDNVAELSPPRALPAAARTPAAVMPAAVVAAPVPATQAVEAQAANTNSAAVSSALSAASEPSPVTVHISPSDAVVFKYGRRLGTGDVAVDVAPGTKITLVAQLDGYTPRTVVLDGSNKSVNIVLSRVQTRRATATSSASKANGAGESADSPTSSAPDPSHYNPYD
jgi:hypothetical protein